MHTIHDISYWVSFRQELSDDFPPDRFPKSIFESPYFFLLESSAGGRYSIAGFEPSEVVVIDGTSDKDPFEILRARLKTSSSNENPDLPFNGGWIGYFSYEAYSRLLQKVPRRDLKLVPTAVFGWYDKYYVYDHLKKKSYWSAHSSRFTTHRNMDHTVAVSTNPSVNSNFTKPQYLEAIERIKNYLHAGDVYQVNLAQKFSCPTALSPYDLYQNLRASSPAPYSAFFNLGNAQILSSSPESFLEVVGRDVITRPIKGTRRRSADAREDQSLQESLVSSDKDRAELLMITDLERNDLGRVCEPGSIIVPTLQEIQSFSHVHHLVATIQGKLAQGKDVIDLLKATFPGGSITGAPKIRAMQIIHELEPDPREAYCGSMGYLSRNGQATFNIAIRTLILKDSTAHFWAGGGIVADSEAEAEYEETLIKAQGLIQALSKF